MPRLVMLAAAGVAAVAAFAVLHSAPTAPGHTIVVGPAASPTAPDPQADGPSVLATPAPPRPRGADPGNVITGIFGELNRDTERSARGQLGILQDLARAVGSWVEQLLRSVSGGR